MVNIQAAPASSGSKQREAQHWSHQSACFQNAAIFTGNTNASTTRSPRCPTCVHPLVSQRGREVDETISNITGFIQPTGPLVSRKLTSTNRMTTYTASFSNTFSLPILAIRKCHLQMRTRLLREDGAERAFLEKLDIFQQNPGLLEKYLIGSEVSLAVLDLFLTRLFGSEGLSAVADAKEAVESVMDSPRVEEKRSRVCEKSTGRGGEHWTVVEELKKQVLDLTRQFSALQRQLQLLQGEVSQVAVSLQGHLDEVASECERRVGEVDQALRAEICRIDVNSQVSDVTRDLEELKNEIGLRVRAEHLQKLAEDVSRLKEAEQSLNSRILAIETRAAESERVLWAEIQGKIERIKKKSDPLDGIIAHLTRECGGNVHEKGIVKVTALSCFKAHVPENAVDLGSDSHFASQSSPNQWICYDFGGRRVTPTSYSIRSYCNVPGGAHPRSWVLEVSNDGSEGLWEVVDSHENNFNLNDRHVICNFVISAPPSGAFRFVRLRQTGKNHYEHGGDSLNISALELFGALSRE